MYCWSTEERKEINPLTPDSAKSKIDKFSKIANWVKLKNKQHDKGLKLKTSVKYKSIHSDVGHKFEILVFESFTVANLPYQACGLLFTFKLVFHFPTNTSHSLFQN